MHLKSQKVKKKKRSRKIYWWPPMSDEVRDTWGYKRHGAKTTSINSQRLVTWITNVRNDRQKLSRKNCLPSLARWEPLQRNKRVKLFDLFQKWWVIRFITEMCFVLRIWSLSLMCAIVCLLLLSHFFSSSICPHSLTIDCTSGWLFTPSFGKIFQSIG